ncbi:hypothetical protein ACX8Z9_10430 [Arthrobacter halodurans]|uniref:Uncharacterized protein n=1 Tax=Arthrobacter halodurans TaxID=516699 RepID=A0ABV4UQ07_9MICC
MAERDRGPGRDGAADDAVWRDLVSRLEGDADPRPSDGPRRPSDGGATGHRGEPAARDVPGIEPESGPGVDRPAAVPADGIRSLGPRDYEAPAEYGEDGDDGGFVPEEPPPLGAGNPLKVLAWCGAAGAPLALLLVAVLWRDAPAATWLGLCAAFLVSAGYLLWNLPRQRSGDDDGSRV